MNNLVQDFEYYKNQKEVQAYDEKRFSRSSGYIVHSTQLYYIQAIMKKKKPASVLDVPVGTARISKELTVERLIGSDISLPMMRYARQVGPHVKFVQSSAFQLPYKEHAFDLVISLRFIRHLDLHQRQQVYLECCRVLKERGLLVFDAVPKSQEYNYRGQRQYSGRIYDVLYQNTEELLNELVDAYFTKITLLPVLHFPNEFSRVRDLIRPTRFRPAFDKIFAYIDPLLKTFSSSREWLVICEK